MRYSRMFIFILAAVAVGTMPAKATSFDNLQWSVQYMIDQSQTVLGTNQFDRPRNNRGLALSPDYQYLYAGYNNPSGGYEVRKIDLSKSDYTDATVAHLVNTSRGKAIATDDAGRVYLADGSSIKIYSADLSTLQHTISVTKGEGIAVARESGQLMLYSSDRTNGNVTKRILTESGGVITASNIDTSWATGGAISISSNLRGVEIDPLGRIWTADIDSDAVYVIAADGLSYQSISVSNPMDIGFDGTTALITREYDLDISIFNISDLSSAGLDIAAPLSALELTAAPATGGAGAIDCIAVIPGVGFFVSGDGINTAGEKSTYGKIDDNSGYIGEEFYTDLYHDDNDPVLFAAVPEPATLIMLLIGGSSVLIHRKKRI